MRKNYLVAALVAAAISTAASAKDAGDPVKGRQLFQVCSGCHRTDPAKPSGWGPNLANIVGRKIGTLPGYSYSSAMMATTGIWTDARLDQFIAAPGATIKGTRMPFAGVKSAADRRDIVAYLKSGS